MPLGSLFTLCTVILIAFGIWAVYTWKEMDKVEKQI